MRHGLAVVLIGVMMAGCGSVVPIQGIAPLAPVQAVDLSKDKQEKVAQFFVDKYRDTWTPAAEKPALLSAIAKTGTKTAADFLIATYRDTWTSAELKTTIIKAMGDTRQDSVADFLMALYGDTWTTAETKALIIDSLGRLALSQPSGTISAGTSRRTTIVTWLKQQHGNAAIAKVLASLVR